MRQVFSLPLLLALGCTPGPPASPLCDIAPGLDAEACAALDALVLPDQLPPARGNAWGDDEGAAALGFTWFYDARFSANLEVRCASCHLPEHFFSDTKPTSEAGLAVVTRNSPTTLNAAWLRWQFWDGRADSLWSQPLFALQAPNEMGYSRLEIAHRVSNTFGEEYEGVFGALPSLDDARFGAAGGPGDAAFDGLSAVDQEAVNRVVANVGKALEAYMRRASTGRSRFDRALGGEAAAMSTQERDGLAVFVRTGCLACHSGPLLGGESFHRIGVGDNTDRGRADGARVLADSPFSLGGSFADVEHLPSDAPTRESLLAEAEDPAMVGAFIASSLRNVTLSAPFGHDGSFETLADMVRFHLEGGEGDVDPLLREETLSDEELRALLAFLAALEGEYPSAPWNNWPDR